MSVVKEVTVVSEGMTVAKLIWQVFQRQPDGYLVKVLEANPGLAVSAMIPVGKVVRFPLDEVTAAKSSRKVVRLWD